MHTYLYSISTEKDRYNLYIRKDGRFVIRFLYPKGDGHKVRSLPYSSSSIEVRKMSVVAPMVMISESDRRIRSWSRNISFM